MKGYDSFARSVWRYDAVEYLIEHPPPLPLAEEGKEFLTNELLVGVEAPARSRTTSADSQMHLAFYEPPEDKFATNADALAAHRWRMNLYILWKRSMPLRERMNKVVSHGEPRMKLESGGRAKSWREGAMHRWGATLAAEFIPESAASRH